MISSKIKNLQWLKKQKVKVPQFFVIQKKDQDLERIIRAFKKAKVKSVIIRSASMSEDGDKKSLAGVFESSEEILLQDLNIEIISDFWIKNERRIKKKSALQLFVQEYIHADLSGVLFTQTPCDSTQALIQCSSFGQAITDASSAEFSFQYDKEKKTWMNNEKLLNTHKKQLEKIIKLAEKKFKDGADIEFAIQGKKIKVFQIRPITRNNDEKLLLKENLRLQKIFKSDFQNQEWQTTNFTQTLGDISKRSVQFYNTLLQSDELYKLLQEAKVVRKRNQKLQFNILENIGGRLYWNNRQADVYFPKAKTFFSKFWSTVQFFSYEKIMRNNLAEVQQNPGLETSFVWLFLSGIYLQSFLEQEEKNLKQSEFLKRLSTTEYVCGAREPRPKSLLKKDLEEFKKNFPYLAERIYDLSCPRFKDVSLDFLKKYYKSMAQKKSRKGELLNENIQFWMKQKIFWKEQFLKSLISHIKKEKGTRKRDLISSAYSYLSSQPFFAPKNISQSEQIIVPGNIDFKTCKLLNTSNDITKYSGKYIAVSIFPSQWIPYIPKLKGIVTQEGNMLSHMAITCREYSIPYKIIPEYFE